MFNRLRKTLIVLFLLAVVASVAVGVFVWQTMNYQNPTDIALRIPKGASVKKIATLLVESKAINNKAVFEYFVRFARSGKNLRAGEYEIKAQARLVDIVDQMMAGRVKLYKLTIPEGYNIKDICGLFVKNNLSSAEDCIKQTKRVDLLEQIIMANASVQGPSPATLEGYLFPETYPYEYDATPAALIDQMFVLFFRKIDFARRQKAKELGFSLHDLVTLASIVEKETGKANERPLIAGVFLNRLKIGMMLQSDPTVIYGIKDFNGNLTRRDLETDSPYNTYTRTGLPAGPICSPGLAAIDAVLNPAKTEFLYFVAKGDGSHYFSKTLEEHNKAVREFQLSIGNGQ